MYWLIFDKDSSKITGLQNYPGGLSIDEWRCRLALAPEDVIRKIFQATT